MLNKWNNIKLYNKYGILNAPIGLLIGGYVALSAIGSGYLIFAIAAPIAIYLSGLLFWKFLIPEGKTLSNGRVIIMGLLTGTISHYLTFLLVFIYMNLCYLTTGDCLDSLGNPPAGLSEMILGALAFSFFSLLFFGWFTAPASILIGLILKKIEERKTQSLNRE